MTMIAAIQEVRLMDDVTVLVGTEITCPSLRDPRFTRGLITAAYVQECFPSWSIYGKYGMFIDIEYGPFRETRELNRDGSIRN